MQKKTYNVLHFVLDQVAPHFLPNYGHPIVKAPNIAALSENAATFENAYTNSPLCVPARAALFTGQLPSTLEVFDSGSELPASIPTFGHFLRERGFATCLTGKCHFIGPDQLHGFEKRLTSDICPADFSMTGDWGSGEGPLDWFHTLESVKTAGIAERSTQQDHDEETTHQACNWLFDWARQDKDRPFYLQVSFSHPHDPYVTPKRYWDLYDHDKIDLPITPFIPIEERDSHSSWAYRHYDRGEYEIGKYEIRNARRAYYGNISYVDDLIGLVLDVLERVKEADNTIIVFCADHGEMLGERGQWYKMTPFEQSCRIPLLIKMPEKRRATRIKSVVSLVDLGPTILELAAGESALESWQSIEPIEGKSLLGLMEARSAEWPDVAFSEFMFEGMTSPAIMVRKGRYKYVHLSPNEQLLYDIEDDPFERNDLSGATRTASIESNFQKLILERWDLDDITKRIHLSQRRRNFIHRANKKGQPVSWDHQPFKNASEIYHRSHITWLEADKRDMLRW